MTREQAYDLQTHRPSKASVLRWRVAVDQIYDSMEEKLRYINAQVHNMERTIAILKEN